MIGLHFDQTDTTPFHGRVAGYGALNLPFICCFDSQGHAPRTLVRRAALYRDGK